MPKPIPGQNYTVVKGDTLWDLSIAAYNDPWKWETIYDANEVQLTPRTPNKWGYLMHPGDVVFIPPDRELDKLKNSAQSVLEEKSKDEMTVVIDGDEIPLSSGRIKRTMDTPADGFTASTFFDPLNERHQEMFKPTKYQTAVASLGKEIMVTGFLYKPVTSGDTGAGTKIDLHCFSPTRDIVDSTSKPPYQQNNVTLEKRIRTLVEPKGIEVVWNVTGKDQKFKKVKKKKTDKIFSHISKLAKQRSVLVSSTRDGDLLCEDPVTEGTVGTLEEGKPPMKKFSLSVDGTKLFNTVSAFGTGPKKNIKAVSKNTDIPRSRMTTVESNDTDEDSIQQAADFAKNSGISEALSQPIPVSSWYAPDGDLWKENTLVTIISATMFIPEGFTFLIKAVEYIYDSADGSSSVLTVVPPSVYTDGEFINPWG